MSLDEDNNISECFINGLTASQCAGDYKNVVFYNESSLVPVLYNIIKEPQKHGTEYKTTMSQIYGEDDNTGVQCDSYLYCDQGEWVSSVSCYNSCQDTVWSLGNNKFDPVLSQNCQPGETKVVLGPGQLLCQASKTNRKKWCSSQIVSVPYTFNLAKYCAEIRSHSNWKSKYSNILNSICDENRVRKNFENSALIELPASNFGKTVKIPMSIEVQELRGSPDSIEIGQVSLYARCEYTGFFSLLALTEDAHKILDVGDGYFKNERGRKKEFQWINGVRKQVCSAQYITQNTERKQDFSCHVNEKIKICHPDRSGFCPEEKRISDFYSNRQPAFQEYIPQGLPIRFFYSYSDKDPDRSFSAFYTAMCDKKGFCSSSNCRPERSFGSYFRVVKAQPHCGGEMPQLDLIFVIDSSGSMEDEQRTLSENLSDFFDQFLLPELNIDYNIAVIDTELGDGQTLEGGNFLCRECNFSNSREASISQTKSILKSRVKVGASGGKEYSFQPVYDLKGIAPYFFRKNAVLAVFFLTDEDDQDYRGRYQNYDADGSGNTHAPRQFINFLKNNLNKDVTQQVLLYMGLNDGASERKYGGSCSSGTEPIGMRELLSIARTEGIPYAGELDLCDGDWADDLKDFGQQIRSSLLQRTPLNAGHDFSKLDKKAVYNNLQCNP